jgi:RND superfamily putative drug exporter
VSDRAARVIARFRWLIIIGWIAGAVAATTQLPSIEDAQTGALGELVPENADALQAEIRAAELFRFPLLSRTVVVQRDPGGLSAAAQARVVRNAADLSLHRLPGVEGIAGALPVLNTLGRPPFAREHATTALTYLFFAKDVGRRERQELARTFVDRYVDRPDDGLVGITGAVPARSAQVSAIEGALPIVELATLLLVAVVVGVHFRAIGAPLLTLAAVALAYLISIRVMAWAGLRFGVSVPSEVEPVIVVLLFGVITDYCVFLLSRFRSVLATDRSGPAAAIATTAGLLPTILVAGLTVIVASSALVVAQLSFFKAFGPGMAMAVLVGLLVAVTFVPAVLAIAGNALFWPSRPGRDVARAVAREESANPAGERPVRSRAVRIAVRHPVLVVTVCVALLLGASSGLVGLGVGNPLIRGLPAGSEPRTAYAAAARGFAPGILSPTVVLVEAPGITGRRAALARLQGLLAAQPGIAQVVGPAEQPASQPLGLALSRTGGAARFFVVLDSDPLGSRAVRAMRGLRARMPALLRRAGLGDARAEFAGDTALVAETAAKTSDDLARIAPVALVAVVAILALFLRALVAPLYLVGASVLALSASLGATAWILDRGLGHSGISYYVPFAAAVLLVALGSDYNVFLVGRVWQEAARRPLGEAVEVGASRAARPITIAGLVLALSFALLAIVPLRPFRELALAMTGGLLIDAFLVRTVFVPALITLVGRRSGWPGHRLTRAPVMTAPAAPAVAGEPPPRPADGRAIRLVVGALLVITVLRRHRAAASAGAGPGASHRPGARRRST